MNTQRMLELVVVMLLITTITTFITGFIEMVYGEMVSEIYYENEYIINSYQCGNGDTAQLLIGFYDEYLTASMIVDYNYSNVDLFVTNSVEYETDEYEKFFEMIVGFHDRYVKC